jgi:hypothetical protein
MSARLQSLVPLAVLALASGCGETIINVSSDGRIEVSVSTDGTDPDTDGFSVTVDGGTARFVAPGGSVVLDSLSEGTHSVLLTGLAENCQVDGSNPRSVVVGPDGQADVSFDVRCSRATTGGFTIQVSTSGVAADTDGYALAVAGGDIRGIGPNASETFTGLTAGAHLITLKDVDEPCAVTGGNPQPFTVIPGKTVLVRLAVVCGAASPS